MGQNEHRQISRDSLFLLAEMRVDGLSGDHKVRVRNVSAGGLMVEGGPVAPRGTRVSIQLRNIGWIEGTIAWVQDTRCGIAFGKEIDPKLARAPVVTGEGTPRYVRPPLPTSEPTLLRKI